LRQLHGADYRSIRFLQTVHLVRRGVLQEADTGGSRIGDRGATRSKYRDTGSGAAAEELCAVGGIGLRVPGAAGGGSSGMAASDGRRAGDPERVPGRRE